MKLKVSREALAEAAALAASLVNKKSTVDAYTCALLHADDRSLSVSIFTGDGRWATTRLDAEVESGGDSLVDATRLASAVKACRAEEIGLEQDGAKLRLRGGRSRWSLSRRPGDDFPPMPEVSATVVTINGGVLAGVIGAAQWAASTESSRTHLTGVQLRSDGKRLRASASNGHCAAVASEVLDLGRWSVWVPLAAADAVKRWAAGRDDIELACDAIRMRVDDGASRLVVQLGADQFPSLEQVTPTHDLTSRVEAATLTRAVKDVSQMASSECVRLTFTGGVLTVESSGDPDSTGAIEVPVDSAHELSLHVDPRYLTAAISAARSDEVALAVGGSLDPILVTSDGFLGIVMPRKEKS